MRLFAEDGRRLFLNSEEREKFIRVTAKASARRRGFCETLFFTGCRLSEALELRVDAVDLDKELLRLPAWRDQPGYAREVPVPRAVLERLITLSEAAASLDARGADDDDRIWAWSRSYAWKVLKVVMARSMITDGPHCTAKGLRHSFAIDSLARGIPLSTVMVWMGHGDIKTTSAYVQVSDRLRLLPTDIATSA